MTGQRKKQVFLGLGILGGLALLPLTLPVLLGGILAAGLDPVIVRLQKNAGMGRASAAGVCVSGALLAVFALLWVLGRAMIHEAVGLSQNLPAVLESLGQYAGAATSLLQRAGEKLPGGAGDALIAWGQELMSSSGTLAQKLYETIFSFVTRFLRKLPDSLFFLMTMILSAYFTAGELPKLKEIAKLYLPAKVMHWANTAGKSLKSALGGWLRAQIGLMAVTLLILLVGFLILQVESPLILAGLVSFLDALPVLGTGTILIPWALLSMMTGDVGLGVGLLVVYAAAALTRNVLEPKVLGATLGLSPLLTLVSIYAGWKIGGLWGMILLPMGAVVASQVVGRKNLPLGDGSM